MAHAIICRCRRGNQISKQNRRWCPICFLSRKNRCAGEKSEIHRPTRARLLPVSGTLPSGSGNQPRWSENCFRWTVSASLLPLDFMSLILALRSKQAVVVAADSQRVESDGRSSASFEKVFQATEKLLCAYAGLLEFANATVADHVRSLKLADSKSEPAAQRIGALLHRFLLSIPEAEVCFVCRRLDVLVASRDGLTAVGFFPAPDKSGIEMRYVSNKRFLVAGDPGARDEAYSRLARLRNTDAFRASQLSTIARSVAEKAIRVCGNHPVNPALKSCCLPVQVLSLPVGNAA